MICEFLLSNIVQTDSADMSPVCSSAIVVQVSCKSGTTG